MHPSVYETLRNHFMYATLYYVIGIVRDVLIRIAMTRTDAHRRAQNRTMRELATKVFSKRQRLYVRITTARVRYASRFRSR